MPFRSVPMLACATRICYTIRRTRRERGRRMNQKQVTWLFVLCVVGVLVIGTFVLLAVGILRPKMALLEPQALETPDPDSTEAVMIVTPTPSTAVKASPSPTPTQAAYPVTAVNLLVNDVPVFALSGRDVAERVLTEYLNDCAVENLTETEHLIRAYIDAKLTLAPVDGSVDYLTYEQAKERLAASRTLVPVVRSVEHAELITGEIETVTSQQPYLPRGARLYRSLGKAEHTFGLVEVLYKSGIAISSSQTAAQTRVGSDPAALAIEEGTYLFTEGGSAPAGKDAGELQFVPPCNGAQLTSFGLRNGKMHYGVDFSLRAGDTLVAPESGTVIFLGERGDYGLVIEIRHGNGFVSRLTHCASPYVELEQHVYRGDPIAILAKQENESQPHLHYELLIDGIPFDPMPYLE